MRGNPFISRNSAFLFAGLIIFGAMIVVGGEETDGVAEQASQELIDQRETFERDVADLRDPANPAAAPIPQTESRGDASLADPDAGIDDFLIDDTEGFDPSPAQDTFAPMLDPGGVDEIEPDEPAVPDETLSEDE